MPSTSGASPWLLAAGAVCAMAFAAGPASAQTALSIEELDANGDGRLERDELPVRHLQHFGAIDRDRDGFLTSFEIYDFQQAERRRAPATSSRQRAPQAGANAAAPTAAAPTTAAQPERRRAESFEELVRSKDRNGDGRVTANELSLSIHNLVMRLDRDGDKAVTLEEAREADRQRAAGVSQAPQRPAAGGPTRRTLVRTVSLMDTNGDGRLQKKEAPLKIQEQFEALDLDGDGAIDRSEAAAGDAARR